MANNFDAARLALRSLYPRNDLLVDDKGLPSVMVYIPKFRLCDVLSTTDTSVHPAFIVNGKEIDGFYMGKYQSCVYGGRQYSLPGKRPTASMSVDQRVNYAKAKGKGWHEVTNAEWAAVALWCHKHGCEPKGNNNSGKDNSESVYEADKDRDYASSAYLVKTGTGPISWSHNGQADGIWDMSGNTSDLVTGVRLVYSELQIIENNNAADQNWNGSVSSSEWKAIRASDGALITPNGSGTTDGSIKLTCSKLTSGNSAWIYSENTGTTRTGLGVEFGSRVNTDGTVGEDAKILLRALALLPDLNMSGDGIDDDYGNDRLYATTTNSENLVERGGAANADKSGGIFYISMTDPRGTTNIGYGSRLAYVDLPE